MSNCISTNTPYLTKAYEDYLSQGFSERNATIKVILDEYQDIFGKLNFLKNSIGKKVEILSLPKDLDINTLYSKEQKAIFAFQNKTFTILKPYTDIIQDNNKAFKDKVEALKNISDQMLAPATAEQVGAELGTELGSLIDNLGYAAPKESENLAKLASVPASNTEEDSLETTLINLKTAVANSTSPTVIKMLTAQIDRVEKEIEMSKKPVEDLTEKDKIKLAMSANTSQASSTTVIPHNFQGETYKIDFDNDKIEGDLSDVDKDFTESFFDSLLVSVFEKRNANINDMNYYFVKHLKSSKFVVFDENMKSYRVSELPKEVTDSKEFKNIENCN